jgi:hypothetical protein
MVKHLQLSSPDGGPGISVPARKMIVLRADTAIYHTDTGEIESTGNVRVNFEVLTGLDARAAHIRYFSFPRPETRTLASAIS